MPILTSNLYYNHITKVRSRQRVRPAAVQPLVMATPALGCNEEEMFEKLIEEFQKIKKKKKQRKNLLFQYVVFHTEKKLIVIFYLFSLILQENIICMIYLLEV